MNIRNWYFLYTQNVHLLLPGRYNYTLCSHAGDPPPLMKDSVMLIKSNLIASIVWKQEYQKQDFFLLKIHLSLSGRYNHTLCSHAGYPPPPMMKDSVMLIKSNLCWILPLKDIFSSMAHSFVNWALKDMTPGFFTIQFFLEGAPHKSSWEC